MPRLFRDIILVTVPLSLIMVGVSLGQASDDRGASFRLDHFEPLEYAAHPQNWSFAQGLDGQIFVANGTGILAFDGDNWITIDTPGHDIARSLGSNSKGTVFVGLVGDFGLIDVDSVGHGFYRSISNSFQLSSFRDIWRIYAIDDLVYFMASEAIFIWDQKTMTQIPAPVQFHTSFNLGGRIFVNDLTAGLHEVVGDSLVLAQNGQHFAGRKIYSFLTLSKNRTLLSVRDEGSYYYDLSSGELEAVQTERDAYFEEFPVYQSIKLQDGLFAFATLGGGTIIATDDGRIVDRLGRRNGFVDDVVNNLFQDDGGSLWIALNNKGILRVAVPRRLTYFDDFLGLEGSIRDIVRFNGAMFAATGAGLFHYDNNGGGFVRIDDVPISWVTSVIDTVLFVGTESGLFTIDTSLVPTRILGDEVYSVVKTSHGILLGTPDGLLTFLGGRARKFSGFDFDVRGIIECSNGDLIVATRSSGIRRIEFEGGQLIHSSVEVESAEPTGRPTLSALGGEPIVRSLDGVYRFSNGCSDRGSVLVRDDLLSPNGQGAVLLATAQGDGSDVWVVTNDTVFVADTETKARATIPELSFEKEPLSIMRIEDDGIVWFSVGDRLLRYNPNLVSNDRASFRPIIESVANIGTNELLVSGRMKPIQSVWGVPRLENEANDLFIDYSAPIFTNRDHLRYSHYLEGRSSEWSGWSETSSATFTNLREGEYTFRVKARNDFGKETPEATFSFVILPPWYRTTWAYFAYLLGFCVIGFLSTKYYQLAVANRKAKEQAIELAREKEVNEKLQEANSQLHVVNERLTEVNALKDEFLATTSHELRTPITAIQGYASILKEELDGPHAEFADIIDSSSKRLMQTLNAVLDLAKLRSGAVDLFPVGTDLQDFCASLIDGFRAKASTKNIAIQADFPADPIQLTIDQYSLKNILSNVLDNSIKFSDGGTINVSILTQQDQAIIRIADEGVGVNPEFLPFVFDEFRQESDTLSREQEGSGLGLSIASRMVDLNDGSITIESEKNVGTTVTVAFKLMAESVASDASSAPKPDREPIGRSGVPATVNFSRHNA